MTDEVVAAPGVRPISGRGVLRPTFILWLGGIIFAVLVFGLSWWRWYSYQYGTFDLAFYVQGLWLALRGKFQVSVLEVPLLGNHAEPIVFLLLPLFAICPHPMLLVAVQVAALASMPFTAARILRRREAAQPPYGGHSCPPPRVNRAQEVETEETRGQDHPSSAAASPTHELTWSQTVLALTTLLVPAAGYIGIHEFHPEAFAAPLLLLLVEARRAGRARWFRLWFVLALGCKENIALLLITWCAVFAWIDRSRGWPYQTRWNVAPLLAAVAWLAGYALVLSPWLNAGRVDYANLYVHLGRTPLEIAQHPERVFAALWAGLSGGNLVWSMLAAFAFLPLLRPQWLLIAAPVVLQHLLSGRSSEWTIYFHYAAPLLPLAWIAAVEALERWPSRVWLAWLPPAACLLLQPFIGPGRELVEAVQTFERKWWERSWKAPLVAKLAAQPEARIACGIPFLSHLATREGLHSIHFVLKGIQTLSRHAYEPRYAPDLVLIDFANDQTFSKRGGFYHPPGEIDGVPLPSSDELIHSFLKQHTPHAQSLNSVAIYDRAAPAANESAAAPRGAETLLFPHTILTGARYEPLSGTEGKVTLDWRFPTPRLNIPWLVLELASGETRQTLTLGMCAPQAAGATAHEEKLVALPPWLPQGEYAVRALFVDQIRVFWGKTTQDPVVGRVDLGTIKVQR